MDLTDWLILAATATLAGQAHINRRTFMAQMEEITQAVQAAREAIEADKLAIIAEIQRLDLPEQDITHILSSIKELGSILDDVPGVTPPPEGEPQEPLELPAEGE